MDTKTTQQVAIELGMKQESLHTYLSRNPHLRPTSQIHKNGTLLWTDKEIQTLKKARASKEKSRRKQQ